MRGGETLATDLDAEVRHRDADRDLVRDHAVRSRDAEPVVGREQEEGAHRDRIAAARGDDRRREPEDALTETEPREDHVGGRPTAGHHDLEVEAGRERLGAAGQDHGDLLCMGAVQRVVQRGEHFRRKRVALSVVHRDGGDAVFGTVRDERTHGHSSIVECGAA